MREVKLSSFMDNEVMEFSRYTISERALPDINGLKPIHKRILWAMYRGGMYSNKPRQKGTAVQGETMKFTPHGDSSIYDALVRLSNDSVNYPLADSQGAMSSKNSINLPAAPRYTSFRLTELSEMCLEDIKKDALDTISKSREFSDQDIKDGRRYALWQAILRVFAPLM